jgi:ABC-type antimicrobial peptide transport system permease subunit
MIRFFTSLFRNFRKNSTSSIVNVIGLSLGFTCFLFIFIWVRDEQSYERFFKNADNIYRVVEIQHYADGKPFPVAVTPTPLAPALKKKYPEIAKASLCIIGDPLLKINNKTYTESGIYVDKEFLEIFDFSYVYGNSLTALKDKGNVIITEGLAEKYFKKTNPVGKTILLDTKNQVTVSAVIKDLPRNSLFQCKLIASADIIINKDARNYWGSNWLRTFILLKKGTQINDFNKKIKRALIEMVGGGNTELEAQSLTEIHLHSAGKYVADYGSLGDILYVRILTLVAIFILLIASINYMNLSTAQFAKRSLDSGVKKILGISRKSLIANLLGESVFIAVVSLVVALLLFSLLLPEFENLTGKQFLPAHFSYFYPSAFLIAVIVGIFSGIYPAFFFSSVSPVSIIKGKFRVSRSYLRQILIVFQFFISITFIIATIFVTRQIQFIQTRKLGIDRENIVYIRNGEDFKKNYAFAKEELLKNPNILSVARGNQIPTSFLNSSGLDWDGKNPNESYLFHTENVDEDYQKTFGLEMVEGRFFSKAFNDKNSIIINQKAAEIFKFKNITGTTFRLNGQTRTIIGVVRDFHFKSLHHKIEPFIFFYPTEGETTFMKVKAAGITNTLAYINKVYNKSESNKPFAYSFLDKDYEQLYRSEQRMGKLFAYFSFFAIFISCMGLFGVTIFTIQNQIKGIGIRKVNGAKETEIITMLNIDFIKWVTIAFIIACPVAWYAVNKWLQNFAYKTELSWWVFILAGLLALVIALLTVSIQSYKAATRNPVEALRYE